MPQEYHGTVRRIVIAFDVGTTFSGSSYCFLEPGEIPRIYSVTRSVMVVEVRVSCGRDSPVPERVLLLTTFTPRRFQVKSTLQVHRKYHRFSAMIMKGLLELLVRKSISRRMSKRRRMKDG